jgi:hypothetical protein
MIICGLLTDKNNQSADHFKTKLSTRFFYYLRTLFLQAINNERDKDG